MFWAQFICVLGCQNQPDTLYLGMLLDGGALRSVDILKKGSIFLCLEGFTKGAIDQSNGKINECLLALYDPWLLYNHQN